MCRVCLTRSDFKRLFPVHPSGEADGFSPKHSSVKAGLPRLVLCGPSAWCMALCWSGLSRGGCYSL